MVALFDATHPIDRREDVEALRLALEAMRREAGFEIARLNRKLAEREYDAERVVATAAERQAMEQDLHTLQSTLNEKEQVLDRITSECRRLEDELEDRHVVFDDLREEVARKDLSLKEAREEVRRLQQNLAELQSSPSLALPPVVPTPVAAAPITRVPPHTSVSPVKPFSMGLISGLLVLGTVGLALWGATRVDLPLPWQSTRTATEPPPVPEAVETDAGSTPEPVITAPESPDAGIEQSTAPIRLSRDPLRGGGEGPTMIALYGGDLRMGHNSLSGADFGPQHDVRIPPFLIGAYEVTFDQYDRFARATGRPLPSDYGFGRGTQPVIGVTWADAVAYADWLGRQTGHQYRLPSEAEWEYVARAGKNGSYPWGFGMEHGRAVCFDCGTPWDNRSPAPVGSFDPNAFGLYDTAGNALEWVADCYTPGYDGAPTDGSAMLGGDCTRRVARGGAFNKPSTSIRTYVRAPFAPDTRLNMLGFRVAREP